MKRYGIIAGVATMLALACNADASMVYSYTDSLGDSFVYDSTDYFTYGSVATGQLASYSFPAVSGLSDVFFHNAAYSDISFLNSACELDDSCLDPTFGTNDIFQTDGTYNDPEDFWDNGSTFVSYSAQLVISGSPGSSAPEPAAWTMMLLGFGSLAAGRWLGRSRRYQLLMASINGFRSPILR